MFVFIIVIYFYIIVYIKIFIIIEYCLFNLGKMGNIFIIKSYMCKRFVNDILVWENRILCGCENI